MDKICLVFDIDETLLHYGPDDSLQSHSLQSHFEYEKNLFEKDKLVLRPGLKKFIDYVKSNGERIILGIWTYGTKEYADKVVERIERRYNHGEKLFQFVYSRENMAPGMLDKELDFIIKHHSELGITKANTFLIDNRPANVIHHKNRNNGIIVESFEGDPQKKNAKMFEKLRSICKSLLDYGKIPKKYITQFLVSGEKTPIASIGTTFDDGLTPVPKNKTRNKKVKNPRKTKSNP
jgi:hypothetical protein